MRKVHFSGIDVHCQFCEIAVLNPGGQVVLRDRCDTTIPALRESLAKVRRPCSVVIEEGPMASWLWRNLQPHVDAMVVSEPRRNHLIAKDGDKDDDLDAQKLALLHRDGLIWKYLGIGLERERSGNGPEYLHVPKRTHRLLKSTILGAARSAAAQGHNPFADLYRRWLDDGLSAQLARRNVARRLAATLWGLWKNGSAYRPDWVGVVVAAHAAAEVSR